MIEILFGESEAASMKAAKNKIIVGVVNGPTSVWVAGKKKPPEKPCTEWKWVEGTSEEVICLGFMLDIGNIQETVDSPYRKELLYSMYSQNQWEQDKEFEEELKKTIEVYPNELIRLKEFLEDGESIRIWYSDAPYSRCGFYYLCQILMKYENVVHVVKMPEYMNKNWGEVAAEEFAGFLQYEKKLSKEEICMYAGLWSVLVKDNSPLRTIINGTVLGVSEEFYDFQIWKELSSEPIKEARLIGNIIGKYPISVGDWWYAKRIEHYIRQGKVCVVEDSKNKYERMVVLNNTESN